MKLGKIEKTWENLGEDPILESIDLQYFPVFNCEVCMWDRNINRRMWTLYNKCDTEY